MWHGVRTPCRWLNEDIPTPRYRVLLYWALLISGVVSAVVRYWPT